MSNFEYHNIDVHRYKYFTTGIEKLNIANYTKICYLIATFLLI